VPLVAWVPRTAGEGALCAYAAYTPAVAAGAGRVQAAVSVLGGPSQRAACAAARTIQMPLQHGATKPNPRPAVESNRRCGREREGQ